ncbi:MAG: glucose 1-dehydrogenase [Acidimicrobiia bacterium]|nr:MAG: glucose 1-dehydrogenase [Acidimicrobiia bacterium]
MERVAVVTGAGQGIGRVIAMAFADAGYDLVLAARNVANLNETADLVTGKGSEAHVVPTDLTSQAEVAALADAVESIGRIHTLVNNSGIGGPSGPMWELDVDEWDETFAVNTRGVFLATRALLPQMIELGSGSVTVIGSHTGKRPLWGRTAYATSKMALVGLVRTLALETGPHGIRTNLISPGWVAGPRIDWVMQKQAEAKGQTYEEARAEFEAHSPLLRLTEAQDVANTCVFLASDNAAGITGADINVNSGVVMY